MSEVEKLLRKMTNALEKEKRNINQFYLTASHTITELHKTDCYVEQLKAIVNRLNHLLTLHEKFTKTTSIEHKKTKEYVKLINQITVEFHYLLATNQAMNDNLREISSTDKFQCEISGSLMGLKEDINQIIKKVEKVIRG